MGISFTDEALVLWNQLNEEEQNIWTTGVSCQKCGTAIDKKDFKGSVYEDQLALFHLCGQCGNKEVRLIDVNLDSQEEVDDDFERWLQRKKEQHPERFK